MTPRPLVLLCAIAAGACNALAGIADFHDSEPVVDAGDSASPEAAAFDGMGQGGEGGEGGEGDAADPLPPGCVPLRITVVASPTGAFFGVDVHAPLNLAQGISAGDSRTVCAVLGDVIDLRANPDKTSALHRWDGTLCGTKARCTVTMTGPVVATVHLQ